MIGQEKVAVSMPTVPEKGKGMLLCDEGRERESRKGEKDGNGMGE